jgi:hypothetical protein
LRTPPSIALSIESLEQAEKFGASEIQVTDVETGRIYSCSIEHFKKYAPPIQHGGFEPQLALPLERFDISSSLVISTSPQNNGTVKRKIDNKKKARNTGRDSMVSPRQLTLKGML